VVTVVTTVNDGHGDRRETILAVTVMVTAAVTSTVMTATESPVFTVGGSGARVCVRERYSEERGRDRASEQSSTCS
jgi:hypothetical protein